MAQGVAPEFKYQYCKKKKKKKKKERKYHKNRVFLPSSAPISCN
jgi:hypothetical protein